MPEPVKVTKEHVGKTLYMPVELFHGGTLPVIESKELELEYMATEVVILEKVVTNALCWVLKRVAPHTYSHGKDSVTVFDVRDDTEFYETRHDAILSQVEEYRKRFDQAYAALVMIEEAALKEHREWAIAAVEKTGIPLRKRGDDFPEEPF